MFKRSTSILILGGLLLTLTRCQPPAGPAPSSSQSVAPNAAAAVGGSDTAAAHTAPPVLPLRLSTQVATTQLLAGTPLEVTCVAQRGEQRVDDVVVRADSEPRAPRQQLQGLRTVFRPETAGLYRIFCRTAVLETTPRRAQHDAAVPRRSNDMAQDSLGVVVRVLPAAPARLVLHLEQAQSRAGAAVTASCAAYDRFANLQTTLQPELVAAPGIVQLPSSTSPSQATAGIASLQLGSEKTGHYRIGCVLPGVADAAEQSLEVVAAPAKTLHLQLSSQRLQAGEVFQATCRGEDAYGNATPVENNLVLQSQPSKAYPMQQRGTAADVSSQAVPAEITLFTAGEYALACYSATYPAASSAVQRLTVQPGLPAAWGRDAGWGALPKCLPQELPLNLTAFVYDAWGNLLEQPPIAINVTPLQSAAAAPPASAAAEVFARGVVFHAPGYYDVSATLQPPLAPGYQPPVLRLQHVYVNSTPPRISVQTPLRAAHLQGSEVPAEAKLRLQAVVEDAAGLRQVTVLGKNILLPQRPQRYVIDTSLTDIPWGMSTLEIEAINSCDITQRHVQSYLYSARYADVASMQASTPHTAHALATVQMGAPLLHNTAQPTAPAAVDNIAMLLESILSTDMLSQRLGQVLAVYPMGSDGNMRRQKYWFGRRSNEVNGYKVLRMGPIVYDDPQVDRLQVEPGSLQLRLTLQNLQLPIKFRHVIDWGFVGRGNVYDDYWAVIRAAAIHVDIGLSTDAQGQLQLRRDDVRVTFDGGPHITVGTAEERKWGLSWLPQQLIDGVTFATRHGDHLARTMAHHMHQSVAQSLQDSLKHANWQRSLALPAPFQGSIVLRRHGEILKFLGADAQTAAHVAIGVDGHVLPSQHSLVLPDWVTRHWTTSGTTSPNSLGSAPGVLQHAPNLPFVGLPPGAALGLVLPDDMINEFLWSTWLSGGFHIPALHTFLSAHGSKNSGVDPLNHSKVAFFAASPPVIMPSAKADRAVLAWGDMFIDAYVNTRTAELSATPLVSTKDTPEAVHITLFASASLEAAFELDSQAQKLKMHLDDPLADAFTLKVQVLHIDGRGNMGSRAARTLETWLTAGLPLLLKAAVEDMPLPSLKITGIAGLPAGTTWRLQQAQLHRAPQAVFTVVQGGVQATRPSNSPSQAHAEKQ